MNTASTEADWTETVSAADWVGEARWSELDRASSLYGSYAWIAWSEQSPNHTASHFVLRNSAGKDIAVLPAFWWDGAGASMNEWYDPHRVFLAPRLPALNRHPSWTPLLLLGSCAGYHSDILYTPGLTPTQRAKAADVLLEAARQTADLRRAARAAMYVPGNSELLEAARRSGARCTPTSAEATIQVPSNGIDGWLATLDSKRRRNIGRELRAFSNAGHQVEVRRLSDTWPVAGRLLGALQRKYGEADSDDAMLRYLQSQVHFLDDVSTVIIELAPELAGFSLGYDHAGKRYLRAAGFASGAAPFAYFNIVIYQSLELAARSGLREINLGTGAYPGKCLRGATLAELWSAVWPSENLPARQVRALEHPASEAEDAWKASGGTCFPQISEFAR